MRNILVDLHTHSTCSDGVFSPVEVYKQIKKIAKNNQVIWSLTDHDSVDGYDYLKNLNDKNLRLIPGCEFYYNYNGRLREMLGYNINIDKTKTFLKDFYSYERRLKRQQIILKRFKEKCRAVGLKFDENVEIDPKNICGAYGLLMESIKSFPENYNKGFDFGVSFFRGHFCNPESPIYVPNATIEPKLNEIIDLIHSFGGLCFVAHPFEYMDSNEKTLDYLNDCVIAGVDGIEIMHKSTTKETLSILKDFAIKKNLLISGGSDFHGKVEKNTVKLFSGINNVNVDYKDVSWAKEINFNELIF